MKKTLYLILMCAMVFQLGLGSFQSQGIQSTLVSEGTNLPVGANTGSPDQPGWPLPDKPVPHHEPGRVSNALSYTSQVEVPDENGLLQSISVNGLDAMAVDGRDPLSGNYTLVGLDKLLRSSTRSGGSGQTYGMDTLAIVPQSTVPPVPSSIEVIPGSQLNIGYIGENDIAAGDLNNDGQAEQIVAWLDSVDASLNLSVGEMPGTVGKTTSAPVAVTRSAAPSEIDLLVRGFDYGLWHCRYQTGVGCSQWDNAGGGGKMLSGPAVVSMGPDAFDIYAVLSDNRVWRRSWSAGGWSGDWTNVDPTAPVISTVVPVPELAAPAVAVSGAQTFLFRVASDNTLLWCHFSSGACAAWESLGGMLASGPAAISMGDGVHVFARGFDDALWTQTCTGEACLGWQRVVSAGMPAGVTLASTPAVVSPADGELDVYGRGSDNQMWMNHFNGTSWEGWSDKDGTLASAVGVALLGGEHYAFSKTISGSLQVSTSTTSWQDMVGGNTPPPAQWDFTDLVGVRKKSENYKNYSVDVETGYIWGDGRSQMVVGYFSASNKVKIALFDISDSPNQKGFTPELVSTLELPSRDYFAITTGDFLFQDGIDDIAVSYINGTGINLEFLWFDSSDRSLKLASVTSPAVNRAGYYFGGTHQVVSGDFDSDGRDELAVDTNWYEEITIKVDGILGHQCDWPAYRFIFDTFIYDMAYTTTPPVLTRYPVDGGYAIAGIRNASPFSVSLAMAAGDVNGDGKDEIVRTLPYSFSLHYDTCDLRSISVPKTSDFTRFSQVISLDAHTVEKPVWTVNSQGNIVEKTLKTITQYGPTNNSHGDLLAVGDFNRDLVGEIIFQHGTYSAPNVPAQMLTLYTFDSGSGSYTGVKEKVLAWGDLPHLVVGDFTRQGLRVGQPTYHKENRVDTLLALINMPPKHRDVIDVNGENQLKEAYIGSFAEHATKNSSTSTTKTTAIRDWGLSADLEAEGEAFGAKIKASIGYSYGNNFEKSTTAIKTTDFAKKATADSHDMIIFYGTPYQVWEYPVLDPDSGDILGYMTVAFPLIEDGSNTTPGGDTQWGDYCSPYPYQTPYDSGHQLYNMWSYDPFSAVPTFQDFDPAAPEKKIFTDSTPGSTSFEITYSYFEGKVETSKISHKVNAGLEVGGKIPMVGEVKFSAKGNYGTEQIQTDEVGATEATTITANIVNENTAGGVTLYTVLYWSKTGYLVLDYQVDPSGGATWAAYDKPDPAFNLPWYGEPFLDPVKGYQIGPTPCPGRKLFSPDVVITPATASVGDTVEISATVHNFSNDTQVAQNVVVRFYQGDPALNVVIGEKTIPQLSRATGDARVSIPWVASGLGKQQIYAVIDPADLAHPSGQIHEMHDNHDLIDNNTAFNYIQIGTAGYFDMGPKEVQAYQGQAYTQTSGMNISFHLPPGNLSQVTRFDIADSSIFKFGVLGTLFSVVATQGKDPQDRVEIANLNLKPAPGQPPAVLSLDYGNLLPPGIDVSSLNLYRLGASGWENASCGTVARFPQAHLIAVPVCSTGTFALYLGTIFPPKQTFTPVIKK